MRRSLTTARVGVRLARREVRRTPWRSLLVLLMVLVPTAAMTIVVTFLRTGEWSAAEHKAADAGRADATARPLASPVTEEQLSRLMGGLPAGSRTLVERTHEDRVAVGNRGIILTVSDLRLADRMTEGRFGAVTGRLPRSAGEVVVNDAAARRLGVDVGDTFEPDRLGRTLEVVGTVPTRSTDINEAVVYVGAPLGDQLLVNTTVWVDLPGPARGHDRFSGAPRGVAAIPGWELLDESGAAAVDQTQGVLWTYLGGGVALVVAATVITAAFAIGARRQLRTIGLLSCSGASRSTTRWFLVTQGAVLGALGSLAGVTVGVVTVELLPDQILYEFVDHPVDDVVTRPFDLLPIVVIGTLVAATAAWLPGRSAARVSIREALAGRRPVGAVPRWLPIVGTVSVGVGCGLLAASFAGTRDDRSSIRVLPGVVGATVALLGVITIAPWAIAGLERWSARWPDAWRLAGRSLGRSRARSSALVGAICAVTAVVVGGGTLYASVVSDSSECCDIPWLGSRQVLVEVAGQSAPVPEEALARVRRAVPTAQEIVLPELVPNDARASTARPELQPGVIARDAVDGRRWLQLGAATPEMLRLFEVPADLRASIERGEAVSVVGSLGARTVELQPGLAETAVIPVGGAFRSRAAAMQLPQVLVSPERAESLGFAVRPSLRMLLDLDEPMNEHTRAALQFAEDELTWRGAGGFPPGSLVINFSPEEPFELSPTLARSAIGGIALLMVLAVVAVGLALAAHDSRDEERVLSAVGAPPRTLRRVGALRGVLLTLTAAALAVPTALLASWAIVAASDAENGFWVDWWAVLFVVAVIPLVVGAVALAGGRVRDAVRPARPDVFVFSD